MNKIYRIIWNSALGQWVVTSELSRGKTKTKTNKRIAGLALASLLSTVAQPAIAWSGAASCDEFNVCTLDNQVWDYEKFNNGAGALTIDDGGHYTVNGPTSIKTAGTDRPEVTSISIKDAYDNGWATGVGAASGIDPETLNGSLDFKASEKEIVTLTNEAGVTTNISISPGASLLNSNGINDVISSVPMPGPATFFYDAGFVKVTNGIANLKVEAELLNPVSRNTTMALADGTGASEAKVVWQSSNSYRPMNVTNIFPDSSDPVIGSKGLSHTTYLGEFTAYDGSTKTVTDFDSYKVYLDWLADEVRAGRLTSQPVYDKELSRAYKTTKYVYDYTISSSGGGIAPELSTGRLGEALLKGQGANATVEIAKDAVLTQLNGTSMSGVMSFGINSTSPGSQSEYGMVVVTDSALGINNGIIRSLYSGAITAILVNKKATFINNNLIELGSEAEADNTPRQAIVVWKDGLFKNVGTINSYSSSKNMNSYSPLINVRGGGRFENTGVINFAAYENNTSDSNYDSFRGLGFNDADSSFLNDVDGVINVGINPTDGSFVGIGNGSDAVLFSTAVKNNVASENKGTVNVGQKAQGTSVFRGNAGGGYINFTNSGTINLDGNRDSAGKEAANVLANVGISRSGNPAGYVADMFHTGTINVRGYGNIALKTTGYGKISSSGTINVYGNDTSQGFVNYGAWSEGKSTLISFTGGNINLLGDNTVGVYASDSGTISLSGDSAVNFSNGTHQIGYYIYGAGSSIINTSTGNQDVSTAESTLMRIAGGASLSGVGGATMTASGEGSAIIVGTDAGTTVSAGGLTLNVSGLNATGVKIEGGALGTIDNSTVINLSGQGAIAAIADGQGHKLDGSNNGAIDSTTRLVAAANLTSSLNGVTGYIARNQASLVNSGNIEFTGDNVTGIRVAEGAVGSNSGNITLNGAGSVGLVASANTEQTTLSSTGNLILNGSWNGSDDATRTVGVLAEGAKVAVTIGDGINAASVNMNGSGSVGVRASGGSTVTLKDKVEVNFDTNQSDQVAFWVSGSGSNIITEAGGELTQVNGDGATLFYVTDGGSFAGDLNLALSGKVDSDKITSGVRVSGVGSEAILGATSQITVGTNATGVLAENAGKAVIALGAVFNVTGSNAVVGKSTGSGSIVENNASVSSGDGSSDSIAFLAQHGGTVNNQGTIDLSKGSHHTAIDVNNGNVTNTGNISANGTAIHIKGEKSSISNSGTITAVDGKAAIHVDAGAGLDLSAVSGTGTIVAKGTADGILLDTGAVSLNVANTVIDMSDATSSGIGIHNIAGISGIKLDNTQIMVGGSGIGIKTGASLAKTNSGTIDVTDGTGILYLNEDNSAVAADLDFSDSAALTVNVSGSGIGVKATLDGKNRTVNTGASVNILNTTGGSAIDVEGAKSVTNSGNLISNSTVADGNVLNVHDAETINNSGTIKASSADIAAIAMSNTGNKTFTNTGDITGFLDFATGDNLINLAGGTLTGNIKANGGANTVTASGGSVQTGNIELAGDKVQTVNVTDASTVGDVILAGKAAHQVSLSGESKAGNVTLGDGNNTLSMDNARVSDVVMGDGGNTLTATAGTLGDITLGEGNNQINLNGASTAGTLTLGRGDNQVSIDGSTIGTLTATDGNNSLTLNDAILSAITLGDGANSLSLTGNTTGTTTTLGDGNNTLSLSDSATLNGALSVGKGKNSLTLADSAHIVSFIGANDGEHHVTVKGAATFGTLNAGIGGADDSLTFDGANYTLANASVIQHFDQINLVNGASFTTSQQIQMGDTNTTTGKIAIDDTSSLVFNPTAAYTLNHALLGTGLVDVQSGTTFDFANTSGNQFAGTVQMNSTDFALSGFNTSALTNAILAVMANNTTTVGEGNQIIGGLALKGGTMDFGSRIPHNTVSKATITADTLDVSQTGQIKIARNQVENSKVTGPDPQRGLLDQQSKTLMQLVSATTVVGEAGNIAITDEAGNVITNVSTTAVMQGTDHAANAHYDYRLTTKDNDGLANGLYVSYGLSQLDLLARGANQLLINTGLSNEKVLSAKVTGSGDLGIKAGNGADALTLSNLDNSYTGVTDLQTGTLIVGTDNALGNTSQLNLAANTTANLNGKSQTIGALSGTANSTLNLNGGHLTLTNGGNSSGALTGSGNVTVAGGTLTVNNANDSLSATTTIEASAEALLKDVLALGSGNIIVEGDASLDNTTGSLANNLSGRGQLNSQNGSDILLSGDNSQFGGTLAIDSTSRLTVNDNQHLGNTSAVQNAGEFIVDNTEAVTLAAMVSGVGELVKSGSGTLTLSGDNTYRGNTQIKDGIVAISKDTHLGASSNQVVLDGGKLQITADVASDRDVTLAQAGSVIVDGDKTATMNGWNDQGNAANSFTKEGAGKLVWTGDNSANTAQLNVADGTLQVENLNNLASAEGVIDLAASGTLSILKSVAADLDFTRQLTGSGSMTVDLGDKDRTLSLNATSNGGSFTGQVVMNNGYFALDNAASATMADATLVLGGHRSTGKVGSLRLNGNNTLGNLVMNGGHLEVGYSSTDKRPTGHLAVNNLDVSGGGELVVTTPELLPNLLPPTGTSLFDQDDYVYDQIVAADKVNGAGSQLGLTDSAGNTLTDDIVIALNQGATAVGNAHYNYLAVVKDDGIHIGYGLRQIDAFAGQSVMLDNSTAVDNSLGAKLTGEGGFTVNATGTVRIGNAASNYTGATDVNSGKVVLITDNGFGQTSALNLQSGTGIDLNGNSQTVGSLNAMSNSLIDINGGQLTVSQGGQMDGSFTGQGLLSLKDGVLNLTENSGLFTGATTIDSGATARLTKPQGLGQGIITNEGLLHLDGAKGTLLNGLKGSGKVQLSGDANMTLGGDNRDYAGNFTTESGSTLGVYSDSHLGTAEVNNEGTLVLGTLKDDVIWTLNNSISGSGKIIKRDGGTVQIDGNQVSASLTEIEDGLLVVGSKATSEVSRETPASLTSDVSIKKNGALGGYGSVIGNVVNQGTLLVGSMVNRGAQAQGTFTINGNYIGDNGTVVFNTDLDGDKATTDRLVITGDTAGKSDVVVRSARGAGVQTANGIKLIEVGGSSNGQFTLNGRAVAGAYEYFLYKGGIATPDDGHWYLRSELDGKKSIRRPEAAGYMANMAAAGQLFSLRLSDRDGRAEGSSMWLRQVGSRTKHRDSSGQLKTATNSYVVQGGGEVLSTQFANDDRLGLGVMMAYGKADSKVRSDLISAQAKSSIDGYSTGLYATWYQDAATLNGAYVDSWVQYSWLNAEVNGDEAASERYDMDGFSASLEAGYRLPVYQSANGEVFITPQAQVNWNGIKADDHREAGGSLISSSGEDNVQTRLGVKISRDGVSDKDKGTDKLFTVYAEANWLYNSQQAGAVLDGVEVKQQSGSRNVGELKLGTEGQVNKHLNLWTNVGQQVGGNGYSDTSVTVGVKYRF
ncbi:Outer membrane protein IcsA autotransporter precursor [Pragia fontium]|uniref:autotransporter outer membrane beta-barrel domain-containing protein n=1 Tax=Pragia fontium TaxID=82985 RepID=UPI000DFFE038|nr:autotransporter outer membrane beta-barrel domain-containing protein [Pragia fontium]SUB81376.1 Outer membrane protein IcsA autotransporter precursor [Pragia fontium]